MNWLRQRPWVPAGVWAVAILIGTSIPGPELPGVPGNFDKVVHLVMYAVLAALVTNAMRREQPRSNSLLLFLKSASLVALFGLADEWHQQFCQRSPSRQDWLADVAGAIIGAAVLISTRHATDKGRPMAEARRITGAELATELAKPEITIVEFWMVGCPACARFAPTFGELSEEYAGRANLVAMEARENLETAKQYAVRGVPSVIVFKDGQEVQRTTGAKTLAEMRQWLEPVLGPA